MRTFKFLSVLLVLAIVLAACTSGEPAAEEKTVKVAMLFPLSGGQVTFGESSRDGVLLAIEEWNAKGGPAGYKIEYTIEDSQCSADPARNAANKVASEGIKYILGEVCSSASIPVSEVAEEKGIIQISPTSTNPNVTLKADGTAKDYVFRACFIDPFQGKVGAKFALDNLGAKTAFILLDQGNDYVRGLAENFEASFTEGGGTVLGKETYVKEDTDFSAILAKVADADPDMVYLPDYYNIVNLVLKQAKEKGITAPFVGGDGWDSSDLDNAAADGGYFTNHFSKDDTRPIVVDWLKNYGAKYNGAVPDALATLAYDAANLMFSAIDKAGTIDTAVVKDTLAAIEMEGVSGKITFDEFHNPIKSAVILQVKDGKVIFVDSVAP
jgi:branched-chain amino acid transport system substrate-binding protein